MLKKILVGLLVATVFGIVVEDGLRPLNVNLANLIAARGDKSEEAPGKSGEAHDRSGDTTESAVPSIQNLPTDNADTPIHPSKKIRPRLSTEIQGKADDTLMPLIIKYKNKPAKKHTNSVKIDHNGKIKREYKNFNLLAVSIPKSQIEKIAEDNDIEYLEQDFQVKATLDQSVTQIHADTVKSAYSLTGKNVKIAVIDSGISQTHPALYDTVARYIDFTDEGISDLHGHGTHVACIIACKDSTYSGIAPDTDLYIAKALTSTGYGSLSDVLAAIDWSIEQKVDIINMSLGVALTDCGNDILSEIVNLAAATDTLIVVAAGNEGPEVSTILSPGCAQYAFAVGAVDGNNNLANFSSRGPTLSGLTKPDIVAPGVNITSAYLNDTFKSLNGTSMAAPHVAGAAALLLEANPNLTAKDLKQTLQKSALNLAMDANYQGSGLAQADVAIKLLNAQPPVMQNPEQPIVEPSPDESTNNDQPENPDEPDGSDNPDQPTTDQPGDLSKNAFGKCMSEAARGKVRADFTDFILCHMQFSKPIPREDQEEHKKLIENLEEIKAGTESTSLEQAIQNFEEASFVGIKTETVSSEINKILNKNIDEEQKNRLIHETFLELKKQSTANKYKQGLVPFKDTDNGDWFYSPVDRLKGKGCITGFSNPDGTITGEFKPQNPVLFGESLKFILACLMGEKPDPVQGHWALGYGSKLLILANALEENLKGQLRTAFKNTDILNNKITRSELVGLVVSSVAGTPEKAEASPFVDLPLNHPYADYIIFAWEKGIISGDANAKTFRPDDTPNRAEVAKIIFLAGQNLQL